nr:polysaccharide deacetylase family protein [Ardenticatenales bacterium]
PPATATPYPTPDGTTRTLKVPILMYHYVSVPPAGSDRVRHDLSVGPDLFRAHLVTLREQGYTSITMTELVYALELGAPLPAKPILLTFDDGYRDNYENAFSIMREEGFVGTFFVVTSLVEERNVNYMTWEQIVEMKEAGMEIGSHTTHHLSLPTLSEEEIWRELTRSRALLQERLGQEVHSLAYPGGRFDDGVVHLTHAAGYWIAVTTKQGVTHHSESPFTLRRIRVRGSMFPPDLLEAIHYWMVEAQFEP